MRLCAFVSVSFLSLWSVGVALPVLSALRPVEVNTTWQPFGAEFDCIPYLPFPKSDPNETSADSNVTVELTGRGTLLSMSAAQRDGAVALATQSFGNASLNLAEPDGRPIRKISKWLEKYGQFHWKCIRHSRSYAHASSEDDPHAAHMMFGNFILLRYFAEFEREKMQLSDHGMRLVLFVCLVVLCLICLIITCFFAVVLADVRHCRAVAAKLWSLACGARDSAPVASTSQCHVFLPADVIDNAVTIFPDGVVDNLSIASFDGANTNMHLHIVNTAATSCV